MNFKMMKKGKKKKRKKKEQVVPWRSAEEDELGEEFRATNGG